MGAYVGQGKGSSGNVGQTTIALDAAYTPVAHNSLEIVISYFASSAKTVTYPAAWGTVTENGSYYDAGTQTGLRWAIVKDAAAVSNTGTATFSAAADFPSMYLREISGLDLTSPYLSDNAVNKQVNPGTGAGSVTATVTPSVQPGFATAISFPLTAQDWDTAVSHTGRTRVWNYQGIPNSAKPQDTTFAATSAINFTWTTNAGTDTYFSLAIAYKDAASGGIVNTITLSDTLAMADAALRQWYANRLLADSIVISEGSTDLFTTTNLDLIDPIDASDEVIQWLRVTRLLQDSLTLADLATAITTNYLIYLQVLTSNMVITDQTVSLLKFQREAIDELSISDEFVAWFRRTRLVEDTISITDELIASAIGYLIFVSVLTSNVTLTDEALGRQYFTRLLESTALTDDQIQRAVFVARDLLDSVEVSDQSLSVMQRFILLTDAISLDDSLTALFVTPTVITPSIVIGFDQPRIEIGGYGFELT